MLGVVFFVCLFFKVKLLFPFLLLNLSYQHPETKFLVVFLVLVFVFWVFFLFGVIEIFPSNLLEVKTP